MGPTATFRPVTIKENHRTFKLTQTYKATIGAGNVQESVRLPPGEVLEDWLGIGVIDFYNQLCTVFASISVKCNCSEMTAGPKFKYFWVDQRSKKPVMLSANDYITNVMIWTEEYINNEKYFPCDGNTTYPKDYLSVIQNIFKRLFRIYAHLYHHHMSDLKETGSDVFLNTSFKTFIYFAREFKLIPEDQLAPLKTIIDQI